MANLYVSPKVSFQILADEASHRLGHARIRALAKGIFEAISQCNYLETSSRDFICPVNLVSANPHRNLMSANDELISIFDEMQREVMTMNIEDTLSELVGGDGSVPAFDDDLIEQPWIFEVVCLRDDRFIADEGQQEDHGSH